MRIPIFLSVLLALFTAVSSFGANVKDYYNSPSAILAEIKKKGSNKVLNELAKSRNASRYVFTKIADGKREWLEVGRQLNETTDTGESESISDLLSSVIGNNPYEVLSFDHFDAYLHCGGFDIDKDERIKTADQIDKEFGRRIKLVAAVSDKALQKNKVQCIQMLKKRRDEMRELSKQQDGTSQIIMPSFR